MIGGHVSYMHSNETFQAKYAKVILDLAGIKLIDYSLVPKIDAASHYANNLPYEELVFGELFSDESYFTLFDNVLGVTPRLDKKIQILHRETIEKLLNDICYVCLWLKYVQACTATIYIYFPNTFISRLVFQSLSVRVTNLYPPLAFYIYIFVKYAYRLFLRFISILRNPPKPSSVETIDRHNGDFASFKIIYFPHQGVYYGNLYLKDQFYSTDVSSPFFPNKILHIEHSNMSDCVKQSTELYYKNNNITYCYLHEKFFKLSFSERVRSFFSFVGIVCINLLWLLANHNKHLFYKLLISCVSWLRVQGAIYKFSRLRSAKMALVGYDYLFPVSFSMALQSLHITVIAVQERYIQAFYKFSKYIFDYYFISSSRITRALNSLVSCSVTHLVPIGMIRTDIFSLLKHESPQDRVFEPGFKHNVLILDYHTYLTYADHYKDFAQNWKANKSFYLDIISLCISHPDICFVIRGKNNDWCLIPEFNDILNVFKSLPNVKISNDYDAINVSYRIALECDFVVARHTSLGDECLSLGVPVIFHDYTHNTSEIVSVVDNYDNLQIFSHNYDDLLYLFKAATERFFPFDTSTMKSIQTIYYDNLSDGCVKQRLHRELNSIYDRLSL